MDIYDKLGLKKLINAEGTVTRLGGSLMDQSVLDAMVAASKHFVNLDALLEKSGEYVANLLGVEAAYITSGAAAGLTLSTAACITGADPVRIQQLPNLHKFKNEVLIQKTHRNAYDQAVLQVGVTLVEFGLIKETHSWELRAAINERTVAVVYFPEAENYRNLPLADVISIVKEAEIPVIVDAAAEIPPVENLHVYFDMGADLTVFSGGKDICGPQCTGLIVGRHDLIRACALNASPNYGIGRPMKVGKEEIAGFVTALELYLKQDFAAEERQWEDMVAYVVGVLADVSGLDARRVSPGEPGIQPNWIPRVYIDWDETAIPLSRSEVKGRLLRGEPGIALGTSATGLVVNPQTLESGQEQIVAQRLHEVFTLVSG